VFLFFYIQDWGDQMNSGAQIHRSVKCDFFHSSVVYSTAMRSNGEQIEISFKIFKMFSCEK